MALRFLGSYIGLNTSRISIVPSDTAAVKVGVLFNNDSASKCDLEPYNADTLSFLPMKHDKLLARGMLDWDYYKIWILEFVSGGGEIVGLRWQWDEYDYPGLWVNHGEEIGKEQIKQVTEKRLVVFGNQKLDERNAIRHLTLLLFYFVNSSWIFILSLLNIVLCS